MDGEGSGQRLLAYLGLHYATHPENLATEALAWLLQQAPTAENGLRRLLGSVGFIVPDQVHWSTQAGEIGKDGTSTIPDLVATDVAGVTPVVVEVKFWAGLTPNQPLGYLPRLPAGQPGILLFVAPATRRELLWDELTRILRGASHAVKLTANDRLRCAVLDDGAHRMALVNWRTLLNVLEAALVEAGQREYAGDLAQLASLANRMDSEAILPLTSEDLTGRLARRWLNYTRLVDDITARVVAEDPSVRTGPDGKWLGGSGRRMERPLHQLRRAGLPTPYVRVRVGERSCHPSVAAGWPEGKAPRGGHSRRARVTAWRARPAVPPVRLRRRRHRPADGSALRRRPGPDHRPGPPRPRHPDPPPTPVTGLRYLRTSRLG